MKELVKEVITWSSGSYNYRIILTNRKKILFTKSIASLLTQIKVGTKLTLKEEYLTLDTDEYHFSARKDNGDNLVITSISPYKTKRDIRSFLAQEFL